MATLRPLHSRKLVPMTDKQLAARREHQELVDEELIADLETDPNFQLIFQFVSGPRRLHGQAPLSLIKYCASLSRDSNDALLYAYSLNSLLKKQEGDLTWEQFIDAYANGLPSSDELDAAWETQRKGERRNLLDEDAAWL